MRGEMRDEKDLREDAKRLLRAAYERHVAGGGRVMQVDLVAGAEERRLSPAPALARWWITWRSWDGPR